MLVILVGKNKYREMQSYAQRTTDAETKLHQAIIEKKNAEDKSKKLVDKLEMSKRVIKALSIVSLADKKAEEKLKNALADLFNEVPQRTVILNGKEQMDKAFWEAVDPLYKENLLSLHRKNSKEYGADVDESIYSLPLKIPEALLAIMRGISEELANARIMASISIKQAAGGISIAFETNEKSPSEKIRAYAEAANMLGMGGEIKGGELILLINRLN
jgi:hypothetical protein